MKTDSNRRDLDRLDTIGCIVRLFSLLLGIVSIVDGAMLAFRYEDIATLDRAAAALDASQPSIGIVGVVASLPLYILYCVGMPAMLGGIIYLKIPRRDKVWLSVLLLGWTLFILTPYAFPTKNLAVSVNLLAAVLLLSGGVYSFRWKLKE